MPGLPPLLPEDIDFFDRALLGLVEQTDATAALLIDQGGPLVAQAGQFARLDTVSLSALAAGAFAATQAVAALLGETQFSNVYQQGHNLSVIVAQVDDNLLLVVIFAAHLSAGMVKYYASASTSALAAQVGRAAARAPGQAIDLVSMDVQDTSQMFRRKDRP
jgi:predicted regulator of Ras-like GTPase activity (Roadblock/LC7/MglB family)